MTTRDIITEPDIDEITRRIIERFHPRRIVLFGSRARDESTSSDVYTTTSSAQFLPLRVHHLLVHLAASAANRVVETVREFLSLDRNEL